MDPFEILSLCAEIAIGITGFTGVVLVVSERSSGASAGRDHLLLRALLSGSLVSLGLIAVAFVLDAAAFEQNLTWRICSAIHVPTVLAISFVNGRVARRFPSLNMPGGTALLAGTLAVAGLTRRGLLCE